MARFKIPSEHLIGWTEYIQLSEKKKNDFYQEILNAPVGLMHTELANYLTEKIEVPTEVLGRVTHTIFSLFRAYFANELKIDTFVDEIILALKNSKIDVPEELDIQLNKILSISGSIHLTIKATYLATDRQNILSRTRILTDLRPVFGIDTENENIKASMVIHNLKVEYQEDRQTKYIYFALDNSDLIKLKENILRAERKEQVIKEQFKNNSLFVNIK